jgi:hypothetical protein
MAWHRDKGPEKLWQAIVMMCKSNMTEVIIVMARKAYQNMKQGALKGL